MEILNLKRSEIKPYLQKLGFSNNFFEEYDKSKIVHDPETNLVHVWTDKGVTKVQGFRSPNFEHTMNALKTWNSTWIKIKEEEHKIREIL